MAKNPKPLRILVHPSLSATDEVNELRRKGHDVLTEFDLYDVGAWEQCDLIVGPNAWRMTPDLLPMVDAAIKAARATKYPKK